MERWAFMHYISWIPYLWVQLVGLCTVHPKEVVNPFPDPFPDDVIMEVLLRLPAEHVLQCRRVCRQWRELTSTPYFIELHLKRASPSLLLRANRTVRDGVESSDLFIFEEASNEEAKYSKIPRNSLTMMKHSLRPSCSWNGLVVFSTRGKISKFFIVNPITREELAVTPPGQPGKIAGIFFNPLTRDYELLCYHWAGNCCNYFIYALGAKTWRKITSYAYWPKAEWPAIVNGHLHWMVGHECSYHPHDRPCPNAILAYSIDREDFHVFPCPERKCPLRTPHKGQHMLVMKEQLCLCYMDLYCMVLDIWVLEDYQNCSWIKTYSLDLNAIINRCPSFIVPSGVGSGPRLTRLTLFGIHNDELLFDLWEEGSFRYHLKLQIVREITKRGMGQSMLGRGTSYVCYTKSLVKLK